jgi:hypothetical protein
MNPVARTAFILGALTACGATEPAATTRSQWRMDLSIVDTANVGHSPIAFNCLATHVPLDLLWTADGVEERYGYSDSVTAILACQYSLLVFDLLPFYG